MAKAKNPKKSSWLLAGLAAATTAIGGTALIKKMQRKGIEMTEQIPIELPKSSATLYSPEDLRKLGLSESEIKQVIEEKWTADEVDNAIKTRDAAHAKTEQKPQQPEVPEEKKSTETKQSQPTLVVGKSTKPAADMPVPNTEASKTQKPETKKPAITDNKLPTWVWIIVVAGFVIACIVLLVPFAKSAANRLIPLAPTAAKTEALASTEALATETSAEQQAGTTETPVVTETPEVAETKDSEVSSNFTGNNEVSALTTEPASNDNGHTLAEQTWGEPLPDQPELYSSHTGEEGYPQNCAGLCWDTRKLDQGVMLWYGPNMGEEDITESDADFGNESMGPLELMRTGKIIKVIFYLGKEAQLETCAIGTIDGQPLSTILGINEGECGDRIAIQPGWHVIENNSNSPIAGFGVRFSASGWAGMTESQIVTYTGYWQITGDTATWVGPEGIEIMMTPSMVQMMQDFAVLKNVVFTTTQNGEILLCNGYVDGSSSLSSPDGSCQLFDVQAGSFIYHGENRLSAGVSWQPK